MEPAPGSDTEDELPVLQPWAGPPRVRRLRQPEYDERLKWPVRILFVKSFEQSLMYSLIFFIVVMLARWGLLIGLS